MPIFDETTIADSARWLCDCVVLDRRVDGNRVQGAELKLALTAVNWTPRQNVAAIAAILQVSEERASFLLGLLVEAQLVQAVAGGRFVIQWTNLRKLVPGEEESAA